MKFYKPYAGIHILGIIFFNSENERTKGCMRMIGWKDGTL